MGVSSGKYFISSAEDCPSCNCDGEGRYSFSALLPHWSSSWLKGSLDTEIRNQTMHPSLRGIVEKYGCTWNSVCYCVPLTFCRLVIRVSSWFSGIISVCFFLLAKLHWQVQLFHFVVNLFHISRINFPIDFQEVKCHEEGEGTNSSGSP